MKFINIIIYVLLDSKEEYSYYDKIKTLYLINILWAAYFSKVLLTTYNHPKNHSLSLS